MSQETLTSAASLFGTTKDIAVSFWRGGSYDEARTVIREALSRKDELSGQEIVSLHLIAALVEQSAGDQERSIEVLLEVAPLIEVCEDLALKGKCHVALAYSYRRTDMRDDAIEALTAASVYHELAGERQLQMEVENNLGNLLADAERYDDAHEHIDKALTLCSDPYAVAQCQESKAAAYLKEGRPYEALSLAMQSVEALRKSGRPQPLRESLRTLAKTCDMLEKHYKIEEERPRIAEALKEAKGHITKAARILGMKPGTLDWKLENQHRPLLPLRAEKMKPRGIHAAKSVNK